MTSARIACRQVATGRRVYCGGWHELRGASHYNALVEATQRKNSIALDVGEAVIFSHVELRFDDGRVVPDEAAARNLVKVFSRRVREACPVAQDSKPPAEDDLGEPEWKQWEAKRKARTKDARQEHIDATLLGKRRRGLPDIALQPEDCCFEPIAEWADLLGRECRLTLTAEQWHQALWWNYPRSGTYPVLSRYAEGLPIWPPKTPAVWRPLP